ncbi:Vacuolar protein sorting-associated protein 53 [Tulasnella sp. 403]|nr:Vacuolar protein sorting-associated protein 53 [Tulasnella sp. 403]
MQHKELPPEVISGIQRILKLDAPSDPLDILTNFSPVDTLNTLFPDESSLSELEAIQAKLATQQQELQSEIDVLRGELRKNQDPGRMQLIQELISELLSQMNRIREKATESEAIVQNITREIQVLDLAKKNLVTSVTALKRLQMLVNALAQLEGLIDAKDYAGISNTLAATKEIFAFFKTYLSIPDVAALAKRLQNAQGRVRTFLDKDFDTLLDPNKPIEPSVIKNACLVVDVLGEDVRHHIIDRYCAFEFKEYRKIFRASDEAGQLDNISRRFSWFRRQLTSYEEEHARIFPESWKVALYLIARFADITRDDLTVALSKAASTLTVAVLLESLQMTLDFESAMSSKYGVPFTEIAKLSSSMSRGTKISAVFEPHMGIFVDAQDKALADMLAPSRGAKSRSSLEGAIAGSSEENPAAVLPSSTELFYFYGQNLEQCAKLSNEKPLLDLSNLHKKWLKLYAEDVLFATIKSSPKSDRERRSVEGRFTEIRNACVVLNTADYCQTTAVELEEKIKEKISDDLREQITLQAERDIFMSVISSAISVLLRELENTCEPAFSAMLKMQWGNVETVSGESPFVGDLVKAIESVLDATRKRIEQKKYLRNFYDKAANLLITRFTNAMVKSRPFKEVGAQQLLIDLQALRACLLRFPQGMESSALSASYARTVTKSTTRLETLLKVVNSPTDPPSGFVSNYTLLVGDSSFSNFQKVLDLKGTPRVEQNNLLDTFLTMTSTMQELETTSFLSSLDMDPPTGSIASSTLTPNSSALSLPSMLTNAANAASSGVLMTPPLGSGPDKGTSSTPEPKREVFSDLRRLVTFAVRKEREKAAGGGSSGGARPS